MNLEYPRNLLNLFPSIHYTSAWLNVSKLWVYWVYTLSKFSLGLYFRNFQYSKLPHCDEWSCSVLLGVLVMGLSHPQSEKCYRLCLFAAPARPFPSYDITHKVLQKGERFHSHVCLSPTFIHDGVKTAEWRWRTGAVAAKTQLSGLLCAC